MEMFQKAGKYNFLEEIFLTIKTIKTEKESETYSF